MQVVVPFLREIERPSCRCGAYMRIWLVEPLIDLSYENRVFLCEDCGHKLHMLHSASIEKSR